MNTITYTPTAGESITESCPKAATIAEKEQSIVLFEFNGITITADPGDTAQQLEEQWWTENNRRYKAYQESQEGRDAATRRQMEINTKQAKVNSLVRFLPIAAQDLDELMRWLKEFTLVSDDSGVTIPHADILAELETAGFVANVHLNQPPEFYQYRHNMGRYIIGQAMDYLQRGSSPHPVAASFVDRYFRIPPLAATRN